MYIYTYIQSKMVRPHYSNPWHLGKVMYHMSICKNWSSSRHIGTKNQSVATLHSERIWRRYGWQARTLGVNREQIQLSKHPRSPLSPSCPSYHLISVGSVWRRALKRLERLSKWSWVFLGCSEVGQLALLLGASLQKFQPQTSVIII